MGRLRGMGLTMRLERVATLLAALALGACASHTGELTTAATPGVTPVAAVTPVATPVADKVSRLPPAGVGAYQLTPADLELDCKKLTGRMAVRIVQIRDYRTRTQTTAVSRTLQTATGAVLGGTKEGTDPEGRYARDRAQLDAYNRRLAEKDCPNFDLDEALDPSATDPPRTRRAKKE
jgi:hypothetical protein